jgi:hypothetical protein
VLLQLNALLVTSWAAAGVICCGSLALLDRKAAVNVAYR